MKYDEANADEIEKRYRGIVRGALHTPPISNEEIIAKSKADNPGRARPIKKKKKLAKASSSVASRANT